MNSLLVLFVFVCVSLHQPPVLVRADAVPCMPMSFGYDSIVCVCNATYCDAVGRETELLFTYFNAFVTTRSGLRLDRQLGTWDDQVQPFDNVFVVGNQTFQTIKGFGGAFTDAATITMNSLSPKAKTKLIYSYFEENGIEYSIGRIPMASCDFSQRVYSYDDTDGDLSLSKFSLAEEDVLFKIPAIKEALQISKRNISLFGSPWSSPYWMKTNNNMTGNGTIKGKPGGPYYKAWAQYFVKFVQAYKDHEIDIWGLTAQNEPIDGMIPGFSFQCLGWTPEMQRDFIAMDLGPALEAAGLGHVKLMILDDQRALLPFWAEIVLTDPAAAKYIAGIAVHWYLDLIVPTKFIDITYDKFGKDFFILNTEACEQDLINKNKSVELGAWYRGERYFYDILQDLKHKLVGWVDWNMALNMEGGPNWEDNRADSPIIVNAAKDEFYKQPMFYAMGHFSKFIRPGSKVIAHNSTLPSNADVEAIFVLREDNSIAANFVNINENNGMNITIKDPMVPGILNFELPAKSFVTFVWSRI